MRFWSLLNVVLCSLLISSCQTHEVPLQPNPMAQQIMRKLPEYSKLSRLEWKPLTVQNLPLKTGMHEPSVPKIRRRLFVLGDFKSKIIPKTDIYDRAMAEGVRHFQWRHGLVTSGEVDAKTLSALNISPRARLHQLQINLKRWKKLPGKSADPYICVNAANFQLDLIKNGVSVLNMKVIVGKPVRQTPELFSKVDTIVLNPRWTIPKKILDKDIIPKVMSDPKYLEDENISVYLGWEEDAEKVNSDEIDWQKVQEEGSNQLRLSQAPGDNNALGRVKFHFANSEAIYMHDTPNKLLFKKTQRAFSSGCVRLEYPFKLVDYFIQNNLKLNREQVYKKLDSGQTSYIRVQKPMSIYLGYFTAWVDKHGYAHFREDIYGRDR